MDDFAVNTLAVNNFGDTRSGGLAGPMGLFLIVLLCIATVLLIRNMNKRLRRLPDSFPDVRQTQREAAAPGGAAKAERTATEPVQLEVDGDRSSAGATTTKREVTGSSTESDPGHSGGDAPRV